MDSVVNATGGTAYGKGLGERTLGFRFVAKTGSADLGRGRVPRSPRNPWTGGWKQGVRKHTWVAGWFPADEPEAILVVFVHDTSTTSSHGAVYLASQFLRQSAVRSYLSERGVPLRREER
jgi:cell division protein FtsI/penicillin-binding protein 2